MQENKPDIFDRMMQLPGLRVFNAFYTKNKSVLLYILFGGLTTIVSIGTFAIANTLLHMNELIANIISWICAVTFAYVTNRIWVFQSSAKGKEIFKEMMSFFGGRLATLGIEELMLLIFVTWMDLNGLLIKTLAQVVVMILNYFISKILVFRNKGEEKNEAREDK